MLVDRHLFAESLERRQKIEARCHMNCSPIEKQLVDPVGVLQCLGQRMCRPGVELKRRVAPDGIEIKQHHPAFVLFRQLPRGVDCDCRGANPAANAKNKHKPSTTDPRSCNPSCENGTERLRHNRTDERLENVFGYPRIF